MLKEVLVSLQSLQRIKETRVLDKLKKKQSNFFIRLLHVNFLLNCYLFNPLFMGNWYFGKQ